MEVITRAGADPATVEISIDVDSQKNILRATATGATELRTKDRGTKTVSEEERVRILAEGSQVEAHQIQKLGEEGRWHAYSVCLEKKSLFGLLRSKKQVIRVMDEEGVIRLQKDKAETVLLNKSDSQNGFSEFVDRMTQYTDAGATLPKTYLFFGQKMSDLSGVQTKEQLLNLAEMELEFVSEDQNIIAVCAKD